VPADTSYGRRGEFVSRCHNARAGAQEFIVKTAPLIRRFTRLQAQLCRAQALNADADRIRALIDELADVESQISALQRAEPQREDPRFMLDGWPATDRRF